MNKSRRMSYATLSGLDCRGHIKTVLICFRRKALYKNIGKYPDLKGKMYGLYPNYLFRINKPYLKLLGTSDG